MTNRFVTHVYALVRVKVIGTNFSTDPAYIAEKVSDAVCASPGNWMQPVHGQVSVEGHGSFNIEAVEFAEGIQYVMIDEIDPGTGDILAEHLFNESGEPEVPKSSSAPELTSLADDLDAGVGADIWFDATHPEDDSARTTIETTKNAMNQAADVIRSFSKKEYSQMCSKCKRDIAKTGHSEESAKTEALSNPHVIGIRGTLFAD